MFANTNRRNDETHPARTQVKSVPNPGRDGTRTIGTHPGIGNGDGEAETRHGTSNFSSVSNVTTKLGRDSATQCRHSYQPSRVSSPVEEGNNSRNRVGRQSLHSRKGQGWLAIVNSVIV